MAMTHKKYVLLKASLPFVLLAAIVVGLYFLLFAPKDYADLVPADARAVLTVEPSALLANDMRLGNMLSSQLGFRPEGLDETQDVYIFITPSEYFAVCAPLHDGRRLSEQFRRLSKSGQAELLPRSDQLAWAWLKTGWLVAWNSNACLALGPGLVQERDVMRQAMAQLFSSSSRSSFRHSGHQALLDDVKGNLRLYSHLTALPSPFSMLFRVDVPQGCKDGKVVLVAGAEIAFSGKEADGVTMEGRLTSEDDETRSLLEASDTSWPPLAEPLRPYAPDNCVLYLAAHSEGDQLLSLLRSDQNVRTMLLTLDKSIDTERLKSRGGDFFLTLDALPKDADVRFRLCIQQADSIQYDEHTMPQPPAIAPSALTDKATGKRAFFTLNVASLLQQTGLEGGVAQTLSRLLGHTKRISYVASERHRFQLTIE